MLCTYVCIYIVRPFGVNLIVYGDSAVASDQWGLDGCKSCIVCMHVVSVLHTHKCTHAHTHTQKERDLIQSPVLLNDSPASLRCW